MANTIALIFDFDDTLTPDSTTALLKSKEIDVNDFWKERFKKLVSKEGWEPTHAWLKLLLDLTKNGNPLAGLTNQELEKFGETLEPYKGLPEFFEQVKRDVETIPGVSVQFWVVSGGLEPIIRGCKTVSDHLDGIWGSQLAGDTENGPVKYIKRSVTFTEKTRYIFEINKGFNPTQTNKAPYLVNEEVKENLRPVPLKNMIYIGDGLTDIPCFSLIGKNDGFTIGILDRKKSRSEKIRIIETLLRARRVVGTYTPDYSKDSDLSIIIGDCVFGIGSRIRGEKGRPYSM